MKLVVRFSILFLMFFVLGCTDGENGTGPTVLIQGVPTDVFEVGTVLSITVSAESPDGGKLDFDYDWKPKDKKWTVGDRSKFLKQQNSALFSWDPLASDAINGVPIQLIFIVTDEAGRRTEKTVSIEIVAGNGKPVFSSNVSEIFDPRTGKALNFEVKVKDQDSAEVDIKMDESTAPIGATFEKTGPFSGKFSWKPKSDQLSKRIRTVRFLADDHQFEEVSQDVTIVVRSSKKIKVKEKQAEEICPSDQIITHNPLGAQRVFGGYFVEAKIKDASRFDKVFVYSTPGDVYNADFSSVMGTSKIVASEMHEVDGSWVTEIPQVTNSLEVGKFIDLSYQICAIDNDAQGDDAIICSPSSGDLQLYYTFSAYLPDDKTCLDDGGEQVGGGDDDKEHARKADTESWSTGHACSSDDFIATTSEPGEKSIIAIAYNQGEDIKFEASDSDGKTLELKVSPCTGLVTLDTSVRKIGGKSTTFFIKISGNDNVYHVRKFVTKKGGGVVGECKDEAQEPNNDAATATSIKVGDKVDAEICGDGEIDVYKIDLKSGEEIIFENNFSSAKGNLNMTLYGPDQAEKASGTGSGVAATFGFDDKEILTYVVVDSGTHYLQVYNNENTRNAYQMDVKGKVAPPCNDLDNFSKVGGSNHTQDKAALLPSPANNEVEYTALTLCPGKEDWYKRLEFKGVNLIGEIEVISGEGSVSDLTWELYDFQGNRLDTAVKMGSKLEMDFTPGSRKAVFHKITSTKQVKYRLYLIR